MALSLEYVPIHNLVEVRDLWDSYYPLFKAAYEEIHGGQMDPIVLNVLMNPDLYFYLITDDEKILGYVCFGFGSHLFFPESFMIIHSLYIRPQYRNTVSLFKLMTLLKKVPACAAKCIYAITLTVSNTIYNKGHNSDKTFRCDKIYTFKVR